MSDPGLLAAGSAGNRTRVFVSYDRKSDDDLYDLLAEQAAKRGSRFEITARSSARSPMDADAAVRRTIRESDHVIVICGEHTNSSDGVATELRIAQEEKRPYLLLWGRRERMCTKPSMAKSADAIYSWTREIVERQLFAVLRAAWSQEDLAELSRHRGARDPSPRPRGSHRATPA
jgi:hypothetical protein